MNISSKHFVDGCACSQDVIVKRFGKQAMQGSICPSSPLCVTLPQIFLPVRWPCFNVSWKGHSGPVHWIRKALLGLYAWLRSSVIPLDTREAPCLHHWQVFSNTHTQVKKEGRKRWKQVSQMSPCGPLPSVNHPESVNYILTWWEKENKLNRARQLNKDLTNKPMNKMQKIKKSQQERDG